MTANPTPGSPEAVKQGCTCPRIDNHHGKGIPGDGVAHKVAFITAGDCPLHGETEASDAPKAD